MTLGARVLSDRYRLDHVLGQGGMAIVYRAEDTLLGRTVAVKVLREQYGADPEFLERFRREARAAASLSHPNVVMVYDVGRDGNMNFIVMEYVDGEDLKDIIAREGPLPPERLVNLGCQLAAALEYAHRKGLIHRDVKPQNVLVADEDRVKVGDFGIAVALGARSITQTGMVIGSVHYMAPEQVQGHPATPVTDVYGLGVVLYEMATGRQPFSAESALAVAQMQMERRPAEPQQLNPSLPPALSDVVMTALAKNPRDRFQSAAEVAAALRGHRSAAAQRTAVVEPTAAIAQGTARTQHMAPGATAATGSPTRVYVPPRAPPRRFPIPLWPLITLALLLGIVAGGIGWVLRNPASSPAPKPTAAPVLVATAPTPTQTATQAPTSTAPPTSVPATATPPATPVPPTAPPTTAVPATAVPATAVPPTTAPTAAPQPTPAPKPTAGAPARGQVPNVIGRSETEAKQLLARAGLGDEIREERTNDVPEGQVIAQNPGPGTQVEPGTKVRLTVARRGPGRKP